MAFPKLLSKLFTNSGAGSKLNPGLASSLPIGAITAFSGNFDSAGHPISSGTADTSWRLCDGGDGTPDLRGRFVLGVSDGHSAGQTGGEATHTLSEAELPKISGTVGALPVMGTTVTVSGVFSETMRSKVPMLRKHTKLASATLDCNSLSPQAETSHTTICHHTMH